jgi:hypothetical protein
MLRAEHAADALGGVVEGHVEVSVERDLTARRDEGDRVALLLSQERHRSPGRSRLLVLFFLLLLQLRRHLVQLSLDFLHLLLQGFEFGAQVACIVCARHTGTSEREGARDRPRKCSFHVSSSQWNCCSVGLFLLACVRYLVYQRQVNNSATIRYRLWRFAQSGLSAKTRVVISGYCTAIRGIALVWDASPWSGRQLHCTIEIY